MSILVGLLVPTSPDSLRVLVRSGLYLQIENNTVYVGLRKCSEIQQVHHSHGTIHVTFKQIISSYVLFIQSVKIYLRKISVSQD